MKKLINHHVTNARIVVKDFLNCVTINIIYQFIGAPRSLLLNVRNVAKRSTIKAIWVVIWKFIATRRSTSVLIVQNHSIREWLLICTFVFIPEWSHTNVPNAVNDSRAKCYSNSTCALIVARSLINARCVASRLPIAAIWLYIIACIRALNPSIVQFVRRLLPRNTI